MKQIIKYILCLYMCTVTLDGFSQDDKQVTKYQDNPVNSSVSKLSKSLKENQDDILLANEYVNVANELIKAEDFVRAEDYLLRAVELYLKNKDNIKLASIYRELAKVQEETGKKEDAIVSYRNAAVYSESETLKEINRNDANRLRSGTDLSRQQDLVQQNINLLNTPEVRSEKAVAHQQMAQIKREMNDPAGAIEAYEQALELEDDTIGTFRIKQQIANTLTADAQYDEAIALNESLLSEAKRNQKPELAISQMQNLGSVYFESNKPDKGFNALLDAYRLALENGQTITAKNVLQQLTDHYLQQHETNQAMALYADFISRLDSLVKNDSTLINEQFLSMHEERVKQLEIERELKDALIARTNRYNHVLIFSIVCILIAFVLITRVLILNQKKGKKIALQSLRREMNPHFIFNSLNSVNQFIAQNNELEANRYLSSYSRLMRTIMENSNKDFIPLSTEIDQMREYLQLEHQRFIDKFNYTVVVDESLDVDRILIPNMLIQPQLENAVWHGLRYKDGVGHLELSFEKKESRVKVTIEDDGIGLQQSRQLKTDHQRKHKSRGMMNTYERIDLLNNLYRTNISIQVVDKDGDASGVRVIVDFPVMGKKIYHHNI